MKFQTIIAFFIFTAIPMVALARFGSETPRPWVTMSNHGDFFFKMVPPKWKEEHDRRVIEREAFGVTYKITEDGEFKEVWRTEGWYTFEGYLSENGRYFVRFGPRAGHKENHTDLAIAFYDRGKLLKEYQVNELIRKPDLLEGTAGHYIWRSVIQTELNGFYDGTFHLVMIDKSYYCFDCETGEIITRKEDQRAKSNRDIWTEQEVAANKKGRELFEVVWCIFNAKEKAEI